VPRDIQALAEAIDNDIGPSGVARGFIAGTSAWGPVTVTAPAANVAISSPLSAILLAGRHYCYEMRIRAVQPLTAPVGLAVNIHRVGQPTGLVGDTDQWMWAGGAYSGCLLRTRLYGDDAVWNVEAAVIQVNGPDGTAVNVWPSSLDLYDIGPRPLSALSSPTDLLPDATPEGGS
jgi:hypothetical protein